MNAMDKQEDFTGKNISPVDEVFIEIDDLYQEAKNWADGAEIVDEKQHDAAKKVHDDLHKAGQKAEELRIKEKKPLDDQINAIQERFNPYTQAKKGKVDRGKTALKEVMAKWRQKEEARKRAEAEKARLEAEEKRREAEAAMQTSSGNIEAREEAEQLLKDAKASEKFAKRVNRQATTGTGLRTEYAPVLVDAREAARHYWATQPEVFSKLIQELAEKDVRNGFRAIPGFRIDAIKKAV